MNVFYNSYKKPSLVRECATILCAGSLVVDRVVALDNFAFRNAILRQFRGLWVALALLLMCLPVLSPFFGGFSGSLPRTDDGNLHLYRAVVLDHSLQYDGWLYPRYASALVTGYGAPLFNYFPPTSYYPIVLLHRLGLSYMAAWSAAMMLFLWIAAGGAYQIGKIWAGAWGGYATAAATVYAPYLLYNAVTRGTITEVAALAVLPWVLWAFTRLAKSGGRIAFGLAVLSYTLFIPLHNIVTVHGTLMLAAYCLLLVIQHHSLRAFWQLALAGFFALALTAFFWLPALAETGFVRIEAITEALDFVDVTRTLRSLGDVLALPRTADPTQLQAPTPITFGWPQLLIAGIGLVLALMRKRASGMQWFALAAVLLTLFMQLPASAWFWENLPLIGFTQFAWRVLGVGSLALALLAGLGAAQIIARMASESRKLAAYSLLLITIVLCAIPWLYRPQIALQADSVIDAQNYERKTGELALSSYSEYLPNSTPPDLDLLAMQERFAQSPTPWRLQPNQAVQVLSVDWRGTSATVEFEASQAATQRFDWLYVPGWSATVDGSPAEVFPEDGFVAVRVDSNQHRLELWLDRTPLQRNAELASLTALFIFAFALWRWPVAESTPPEASPHRLTLTVAILGIALFAGKTLIDTTNNPLHRERFSAGIEAGAEIPVSADFRGGIRLVAAHTPESVLAGAEGQISLFWALSDLPVAQDFSSLLILREPGGQIVAEARSFYPGGLATSNWLSGYYLEDLITLQIPDYTPPGNYTLEAGLYVSETGERLNVLGADGNPVGISVPLDSVEILRGTQPETTLEPLGNVNIGDQEIAQLVGVDGLPESAQVGDLLTFTWLWKTQNPLPENVQARLIWQNDTGEAVESDAISLTLYPSEQWQIGDIWRGYPQVFVPAHLDAGEYDLVIQVGGYDVFRTPMTITTPDRVYDLPEFAYESGAEWGNGITLLGYDFSRTGLTLHWQTTAPLLQSLRLFVQIVDDEDRIVALTDGIPADWTRPTTSWVRDEIVSTTHLFEGLPPGNYRVRVGWYLPESGGRVHLNSGEDALILEERFVIE